MSHRRTTLTESLKEEYKKAQASIYSQSSFKDWVGVTISTNIVLVAVCIVLYTFFHNPFIIPLISIALALSGFFILVTLHEMLHGLVAQYYGYTYEFGSHTLFVIPKLGRPFTSIYIEVLHPADAKWNHDKVIIALAPHFILLPVSIILMILGYYYSILFLSLLGLFTAVGHLIALYIDVKAT